MKNKHHTKEKSLENDRMYLHVYNIPIASTNEHPINIIFGINATLYRKSNPGPLWV